MTCSEGFFFCFFETFHKDIFNLNYSSMKMCLWAHHFSRFEPCFEHWCSFPVVPVAHSGGDQGKRRLLATEQMGGESLRTPFRFSGHRGSCWRKETSSAQICRIIAATSSYGNFSPRQFIMMPTEPSFSSVFLLQTSAFLNELCMSSKSKS